MTSEHEQNETPATPVRNQQELNDLLGAGNHHNKGMLEKWAKEESARNQPATTEAQDSTYYMPVSEAQRIYREMRGREEQARELDATDSLPESAIDALRMIEQLTAEHDDLHAKLAETEAQRENLRDQLDALVEAAQPFVAILGEIHFGSNAQQRMDNVVYGRNDKELTVQHFADLADAASGAQATESEGR